MSELRFSLHGKRSNTFYVSKDKLWILFLTGYARVEDRMRALAAGYQMFVPKPVEAHELAVTIANLIGRAMKLNWETPRLLEP